MTIWDGVVRVVVFAIGVYGVLFTIQQLLRTLVLPRSDNTFLARLAFLGTWKVFHLRIRTLKRFEDIEPILAMFSPVVLFVMPLVLMFMLFFFYSLLYWAVMPELSVREVMTISGSSLTTLGVKFVDEMPIAALAYTEAILGTLFIATLIGYLPTTYSAFSARERLVMKLDTRAGTPPSAVELVCRSHAFGWLHDKAQFEAFVYQWEDWLIQLETDHTTLIAMNFLRSSKVHSHWLSTTGVVLDACALFASCVDLPYTRMSGLPIRTGTVALSGIAAYFQFSFNHDPAPTDAIRLTRADFDQAYAEMLAAGVPLLADRDQCWRDFAGWRVNYDEILFHLVGITAPPYTRWVSDHLPYHQATIGAVNT